MLVVTFIIAIVALIISILVYRRTGGDKGIEEDSRFSFFKHGTPQGPAEVSLKEQIETLSSVTESLRDRTANAIDRLEKALRGRLEEKPPEEKPPEEKPSRPKRPRTKRE